MSVYFQVLGNFDPIRTDGHFVFLFQFLLLTPSSAQRWQSHAPRSAGMFLDVLPISTILSPSEPAALGHVYFVSPHVLPLLLVHPHFWSVTIVKNLLCLFIPLSTDNFIKLSLFRVEGIKINETKFSLLNQTVVEKIRKMR